MITLNGKQYTRRELEQHAGHISQIAGVRMMELHDGPEAGVRIADVRSGSGLRFQVTLDRGMDISLAEYKGTALAWRSPNGDVHPCFYDPKGLGWLKSFPGGLVTGCGLTQAGAPGTDDGEELGLHGRLSNTPATHVETTTEWEEDSCKFKLSGIVRENTLFRQNITLHRTIEVELGSSVFTLRDTVVNEGFRPSPLMLLYHVNLGWPLLDDGAVLMVNAEAPTPRDAEAMKGVESATKIPGPIQGYKEQVFYHDLIPDWSGFATALLANRRLHLGLYVEYRQKELPKFTQWKMVGEGEYVLGMEPANCLVQGRAKERERGTLKVLDPGEQREFLVRIGIVDGDAALDQFIQEKNLR
ncbi:MAG: aldose 1-epimerase family protein [Ignavibacteriales bacterium]|nr:aldose 1-epimerase family protein [Ignavibacteriales bacterium]